MYWYQWSERYMAIKLLILNKKLFLINLGVHHSVHRVLISKSWIKDEGSISVLYLDFMQARRLTPILSYNLW